MDIIQLADQYLYPYIQKSNEIVPELCPFCNGGRHHDKQTFALNIESGLYNCKRGSCGAEGNIYTLNEHFGEKYVDSDYVPIRKPTPIKKKYKKPEIKPEEELSDDIIKYFAKRGIKEEVLNNRRVASKDGNIIFKYYEDGKLVMLKFKIPRKPRIVDEKKERKSWRETGGKPVLWGLDDCDYKLPLVIVEGEPDALIVEQAGVRNVTSIPSGTQDLGWIELQWDKLKNFETIIIWFDNDEAGKKATKEVVSRLGYDCCKLVESEHKDANVHWYLEGGKENSDIGNQSIREVIEKAEYLPVSDTYSLADVEDIDVYSLESIDTRIDPLDECIGGLKMTLVTLLTAKSGAGKSTLVNQLICNAVDQGFKTGLYSGELTGGLLRYWIELTMAGEKYIKTKEYFDEKKGITRIKPAIDNAIKNKMRKWYRNNIYLYDTTISHDAYLVLDKFEQLHKRYGCKLFIIDNIMTLDFNSSENEKNTKHSEFIRACSDFAKKNNSHVVIVIHPRKTFPNIWIQKEDIKGTGDFFNAVDNVLALHKISEQERLDDADFEGVDLILDVWKNRIFGDDNLHVALNYSKESHRIYKTIDELNREYDWNDFIEVENFVEYDAEESEFEGMFSDESIETYARE